MPSSSYLQENEVATPSLLREYWYNFSRQRNTLIALLFFLWLIACAIFLPFFLNHDPFTQYHEYILRPPAWESEGISSFLLGTDSLGRDMLARLIYGARLSLQIGVVCVFMSLIPGVFLGMSAVFFPKTDMLIMRLMDILMALPTLLLAVAIVAAIGPGVSNTTLAIAIVSLPGYVRIVRASTLTEINKEYVTASRLAGASTLRLMLITVLPNCVAPLIVHATLGFSAAILDAAALGFLGLGVQPPLAEWGTMLADARDYIGSAWWVVTLPGLAILFTVLSINIMGDGLRDALDPKLSQRF